MNKIKLAHAAESHAFLALVHPSFSAKYSAYLNDQDKQKRHQYRYQRPFRRRSRHSVCPVFSAHNTPGYQRFN
ncbi:hypothetical protein [Escherichia coli]|uniref:hypothetical protein n=1 Tax=Escherichia coli TaxID=562 RepID=UPI001C40855B|nr:hypothetical protein [Escherichia coli]